MYYLVNMDHTAWQCISLEVAVKGFKKCCVSSAMNETGNGILWDDCEDGDSDTDW
jgi:hypothetical protein